MSTKARSKSNGVSSTPISARSLPSFSLSRGLKKHGCYKQAGSRLKSLYVQLSGATKEPNRAAVSPSTHPRVEERWNDSPEPGSSG